MKTVYQLIISGLLAVVLFACEEKTSDMTDFVAGVEVPSGVKTGELVDNYVFVATVRGSDVTESGGSLVQDKGIICGTAPNLQATGTGVLIFPSKKNDVGDFDVTLNDLKETTTYYYRAYAINTKGISYGEEKSFTTGSVPTVTALFDSEAFGLEGEEITVGIISQINYYRAYDLYEEGYDIVINVSGGKATVAKQPAWVDSTYGIASVEGSGSFDGKTFTLMLKHTVSAGSFGTFEEKIVLPD